MEVRDGDQNALVALPQIIQRLPDIRLAGPTTVVQSTFINSLASMPVSFTPGG